jgi:hypothetical protein
VTQGCADRHLVAAGADKQEHRRRPPQVVEPDLRQTGLLDEPVELLGRDVAAPRATVAVAEEQPVVVPSRAGRETICLDSGESAAGTEPCPPEWCDLSGAPDAG